MDKVKSNNNNEDADEKRERSKAYFMRDELTTAENFFNVEKSRSLDVTFNSIHNMDV
jgi:hypothetical protein